MRVSRSVSILVSLSAFLSVSASARADADPDNDLPDPSAGPPLPPVTPVDPFEIIELAEGVGIQQHEIPTDWDAFLEFDETCWDQIHGVVKPEEPSIYDDIYPGDVSDVMDGGLEVPLAFPDDPTTGGEIDTCFWDDDARTQLLDCFANLPEPYEGTVLECGGEIEGPTVMPSWIVAPEPSSSVDECIEDVLGTWGTPCLEPTAEDCLSLEYLGSWCGRLAFEEHGEDPEWVCNVAIEEAASAGGDEPHAQWGPVLVPEVTWGPTGTRRHHLEREHGWKIDDGTSHTSHDAQAYGSAGAAMASEIAEGNKHAWYATNGGAFSCDEYAYEATYDYGLLEDTAISNSRRAREIYERVFGGSDPMVENLGGHPGLRWDFRANDGEVILDDPFWSHRQGFECRDDGLTPWPEHPGPGGTISYYQYLQHPEEGPYRVFPRAWGSCNSSTFTFKNVYYYLYQLRRGPSEEFSVHPEWDLCQGWADSHKTHYRVNSRWHEAMSEAMKLGAYTDDELAYLARKQTALLDLYDQFLDETSPSKREDLTHQIDEALVEGAQMGCIPTDPSRLTPCDWAPEYFAEGAMTRIGAFRDRLEQECTEVLGEGPLASLHEQIFNPVALAETLNPVCQSWGGCPQGELCVAPRCPHPLWDDINDLYAEAATCPDGTTSCDEIDYTADYHGIRRFLDRREEYLDMVTTALATASATPGVKRRKVERALGNDWFSGTMKSEAELDMLGEQPEYATQNWAINHTRCGVFPEIVEDVAFEATLLQIDLSDLIMHVTAFVDTLQGGEFPDGQGEILTPEEWANADFEFEPFEFDWVGSVRGEYIDSPTSNGYCASYSLPPLGGSFKTPPLIVPFDLGPVWLLLRMDAGGSMKLTASADLCWGAAQPPSSIDDPVNEAQNIDPCPDNIHGNVAVAPSVSANVDVSVGLADKFALTEVGVEVDVTLAELSLPARLGFTTDLADFEVERNFEFAVVGTFLKATLRAYVRLLPLLSGPTVFSATLAQFGGIAFNLRVDEDGVHDPCVSIEAQALILGNTGCAIAGCDVGLADCF